MQKAKALHYATHDTPCNEQRAVAIEKRYTERDQVGTAFCNRNNQLRRKNFARCIFVLHCNVSLTGLAMLEHRASTSRLLANSTLGLRPCLYGLGCPRQPSPSRQLYGAFIWSCEL